MTLRVPKLVEPLGENVYRKTRTFQMSYSGWMWVVSSKEGILTELPEPVTGGGWSTACGLLERVYWLS